MRRIGTLESQELARRFCDYLMTRSISATCDAESDEQDSAWNIWVRDERQIEEAKQELVDFRVDPQADRFQVEQEVKQIRQEKIAAEIAQRKQAAENARRSNLDKSALGQPITAPLKQTGIPVTIAVIVLSVIASLTTNFGQPRGSRVPGKLTLEEKTYDALSFVNREDFL